MEIRSKQLLSAAGLLIVAAVVVAVVQKPVLSDHDQISSQIAAITGAAERRATGGIMAEVSSDYRDSLFNNSEQLAYVLHSRMAGGDETLRLNATTSTISVAGDTATSITNVQVESNGRAEFAGNVTLDWRKEPSHRMLIVPDTVWHVISAHYPASLGDLEE